MPGSETDGRSSLTGNLKTVKVKRLWELMTEAMRREFVCAIMCVTLLQGKYS